MGAHLLCQATRCQGGVLFPPNMLRPSNRGPHSRHATQMMFHTPHTRSLRHLLVHSYRLLTPNDLSSETATNLRLLLSTISITLLCTTVNHTQAISNPNFGGTWLLRLTMKCQSSVEQHYGTTLPVCMPCQWASTCGQMV